MKMLWLIPLLLVSCTPLLQIAEYGAQGGGLVTGGKIGGCTIDGTKTIPAGLVISYKGEKCIVSYGGGAIPAPVITKLNEVK